MNIAKPKMTEVVTTLVDALTIFDSGERRRIIKAALTILEEGEIDIDPPKNSSKDNRALPAAGMENIHLNAQRWLKQNGLSRDDLDHVFQIESGSADVLRVTLPGKKKAENTHSAYVLTGLKAFIVSGDPTLDDKTARQLCKDLGCYDESHHSEIISAIGNVLSGAKNSGYKLTTPGLTAGATLIKKLVPPLQ
jgi:hypothetical protein